MTAIKNWFLEKNNLTALRGKELTIKKETTKAVLIGYRINDRYYQDWIPKSCLTDKWEKDTSNFGYHDYLVDTVNKAYTDGKLENKSFKSGRNVYDSRSFTHQMKTKELIDFLTKNNIEYMNRTEWNNRSEA